MRATRAVVAVAASAAALTTLALPAATVHAAPTGKITATATTFCTADGDTRVRVRVKNTTRQVRTVAITRRVGDAEARTSTTWLDAPDAKKVAAFRLPAAGRVKVVLAPKGDLDGAVLLNKKVTPLDC